MREISTDEQLQESLISAWVRLTSSLKNSRITQGMNYNEAIIMLLSYNRYRKDGIGLISFKELVQETKMLKSLVNRTIDSLVKKGFLVRCDGEDKRTTFVRPVHDRLQDYLRVHRQSLELAQSIIDIIGMEDAQRFIMISEKITAANPLNDNN